MLTFATNDCVNQTQTNKGEVAIMSATLRDVAALAGVHTSTVSRVLRGKENLPIASETRQRILDAAKKLNYQPDQMARALRLKKSNTIGLIVPDISNSFFAEIARSIEAESYQAGYTLVVCNTNEDQEKEIRFVNNLISRAIDGLIIAPVQDTDLHIRELKNKKFPFVLIDRCFEDLETNFVIGDNEEAAFNAMAYLTKLGHRRIGFLSGRQNIYTIRKRLEGYKRAVAEFGLCNGTDLISGNSFTFESGYEAVQKLLGLANPPTALLLTGNIISIGAIKAITDRGLRIPNDISIIGFVDNVLSPYLFCPLTTISHPLEEMGQMAFAILLEHMQSKETRPHAKIVVKTQLNERKSTDRVTGVA